MTTIPSSGFTFPPANNTDFITELYIGYYNRAPDPAGMSFWLNAMAAGATLTQVANAFANSSESTAIYPFLTLPNLVNASERSNRPRALAGSEPLRARPRRGRRHARGRARARR